MKNITLLILLTQLLSLNLFSQQKDSIAFNNFKKILPYTLKPNTSNSYDKIDGRVRGEFYEPWKLEKINKEKAEKILGMFIEKGKLKTELDFRGNPKLVYSASLNSVNIEKLENLNIKIQDFKILNSEGKSILTENTGYKYNESRLLDFNNHHLVTSFPITSLENKIVGEIEFTINEYQNFSYKKININKPVTDFKVDNYHIRLIKIEKNKAYFEFPKDKIKNLEIVATNKNNEAYTLKMLTQLPKKVHYFKKSENINDKNKVNKFISSLSYKDIYDSPKVAVFTTNGIIENIYLYIKKDNNKLSSQTYKVKFENK